MLLLAIAMQASPIVASPVAKEPVERSQPPAASTPQAGDSSAISPRSSAAGDASKSPADPEPFIDPSEYGLFNSEPEQVEEPTIYDLLAAGAVLGGFAPPYLFFKPLRVALSGSPDFYYLRSDVFSRLGRDPGKVIKRSVFGPFPSGAVVKARRQSEYHVVFQCHDGLRLSQISTDAGSKELQVSLSC